MTPATAIAQLDRQLAEHGEDIVLSRQVDDGPSIDVICRARVSGVDNGQISAGLRGNDLDVIISPTQIDAAAWPDGNSAHRVPEINGDDKIIRQNQPARTISFVDPRYINNVLVRINLRVTG